MSSVYWLAARFLSGTLLAIGIIILTALWLHGRSVRRERAQQFADASYRYTLNLVRAPGLDPGHPWPGDEPFPGADEIGAWAWPAPEDTVDVMPWPAPRPEPWPGPKPERDQ
jgi:hypothetical protein